MKLSSTLLACSVCFLLCLTANATVTFDWATIGNAGNVPDQVHSDPRFNPNNLRFGKVDYVYRISRHEVTNSQYAEFLNSVAANDPNGLYHPSMDISRLGNAGAYSYSVVPGQASKPIDYVSYLNSMRFVNWLENGQPIGVQSGSTTEAGTYTIGTGLNEVRRQGARFFIPTEDEWYKAAYYDPRMQSAGGPPGNDNYWLSANQIDFFPSPGTPPGGLHSLNASFSVGTTTNVGAYSTSTSFYGTFDQGGNVWEWNEALIMFGTLQRGQRGGSWANSEYFAFGRRLGDPTSGNVFGFGAQGIRIASAIVPEPTSATLMLFGPTVLGTIRRRK